MSARLEFVDFARGLAIIGVVLFHLVWDLEFTGFLTGIASHPAWLLFGRMLAGTFMLLVGVNLVLGHGNRTKWISFWRRLAVIIAAAATITILTRIAFPQSFIFYGILHSIAVSSLAGILFVRSPFWVCLIMAGAILILPQLISSSIFDSRWLAWIGLFANPPVSYDFVPFFPWTGLTFLGMALVKIIPLEYLRASQLSANLGNRSTFWIGWAGRKSLPIYLIHQPVLLAIIAPASWLLGG